MKPITPAEICWSETDGGVSINPEAVAQRLNDLLEMIRWLQAGAVQCGCGTCGTGWPAEQNLTEYSPCHRHVGRDPHCAVCTPGEER